MRPLLLVALLAAQLLVPASCEDGVRLSSQQLKEGLDRGDFDVLIDVRTRGEWDEGHIDNATQMFELAKRGVEPTEILGCRDRDCTIAVYCHSGVRAGNAIKRLINEYGFASSNLYNGLGVKQWREAGYSLVKTDEVPSKCNEPDHQCKTCNRIVVGGETTSTTTDASGSLELESDQISTGCTKDENGVLQFEASLGVRGALAPVSALVTVAAVISLF